MSKRPRSRRIPHFTGSLDAKIPAENIVFVRHNEATGRWVAFSRATDGSVFHGDGATEPLARRAAGLRTFQHLEAKAKGELPGLTAAEIEAAKAELVAELERLRTAIEFSNEPFPDNYSKTVVLIELAAAKQLISQNDKLALARWLVPLLIFLAGAFAEGVIGVYAQRALELLERLSAG